jgi:antitoxin HicB
MVYYCRLVEEEGVFLVEFPDVPNAITSGRSEDEALFNAAEALNGVLESDISHGYPLPEAATGPGMGLHQVEVEPHVLIAWELRKLRGDRPQSEIAAKLGLSYQAYQRLENPAKGNPTVRTLQRVAKAFDKHLIIDLV